jgi:hypothetical protein
MIGIGCCTRAATGHAAAAPPSSAPLHSISLVGAQEECLRARSCDFSEI